MKISRVDTCKCLVGEGPVWDAAGEALFFLDIAGSKVHRFTPRDGRTRSWDTPLRPGAMALRQGGGAIVAMQDRIFTLDLDTGSFELIATADAQSSGAVFNDGKVDRQGRFIIGSCCSDQANPMPIGGILKLDADHRLAVIESDIAFSNGPCFSPDGATLYFADSARYSCFAYDYDIGTGEVGDRRLFADTRPLGGMPDGATVDSDGLVWMAIFRGGKVAAFRPDGKVERIIDMPVSLSVSTMFGGPDLDQLYVTTIDPVFFGEAPEEGAGFVHVIEGLGVRGLPEPRYAG